MSVSNSSSIDMISSTRSSESAPRSSTNDASGTTSSRSTPNFSAIIFLTVPLYAPLIIRIGFDPIWFGTLFIMTCETAYLTPPYGFNLFYMRAIAPPELTMEDIYMSIIPFVGLQLLAIGLVVIFPQIALWLPNKLFGG